MTKIGQTYTWSITQYNTSTGQPYTDANKYLIVHGTYVDTGKKYDTALGGIGSVMLKKPITEDIEKVAYTNPFMSITNLYIWQANSVPSTTPTYIASANQEIVLNCEDESTTIGGKLVSPVWSTDYPKLSPGVNSLTMTGDLDDATIVLKYLPRLL